MSDDHECGQCHCAIDEYPCAYCDEDAPHVSDMGRVDDLGRKTNAELDRLVAVEWMKWAWREILRDDGSVYLGGWGKEGTYVHMPLEIPGVEIWSPTTDGNHMLELLAEVERRGWGWQLHMHQAEGAKAAEYVVMLFDEDQHAPIQEWAAIAARAVVLAVLAAGRAGPV